MTAIAPVTVMPPASRRSNAGARNWELWTGLIIVGLLVLFALTALLPGADGYSYSDQPFAPPSAEHPLGTDNLGRDSATRLAMAVGTSLWIAVVSTVLAAMIGTGLALVAGYGGQVWDAVIMRTMDLLLSIPGILMALIIKVVLGPGMVPLIITMVVIFAPVFTRIMRAPVLAVRERGFVQAAAIAGRRRSAIALRHILPNITTPLLVTAAGIAGETVLLEATLSYLGQGIQAPEPSLGRMINEFQKVMALDPLLVILPAALIILEVSAWNLLADGAQNALAPRRGGERRASRVAMASLLVGRRAAEGPAA